MMIQHQKNLMKIWEVHTTETVSQVMSLSLLVLKFPFKHNLSQGGSLYFLRLQAAYHISDAAITCILKFLAAFLIILSNISSQCADLAKVFPKSLYMAKRYFAGKVNFIRYVICKKCFNIYLFQDCIEGPRGCRRSKLCCTREYPNHPHRSKRGACNGGLLKTVELVGGRRILYPYLVYCYLGIEIALQHHFRNPRFEILCEKWRSRNNDGSYSDLYDGNVWKVSGV